MTVPDVIDIAINGRGGFYTICAYTAAAREWCEANVHGYQSFDSHAYSDDTNMTQDTADGAFSVGLNVQVNGRRYYGENCGAA